MGYKIMGPKKFHGIQFHGAESTHQVEQQIVEILLKLSTKEKCFCWLLIKYVSKSQEFFTKNEKLRIVSFRALRERIAEALLRDGYCYKYDISLPLEKVSKMI